MSDTCRSCDAPVIRLRHETTDNQTPIDRDPVPHGNLVLDLAVGTYRVLTAAERNGLVPVSLPRHTNHFATCPQARQWRRRRR